jgi:parvulin-like peptidyl-prolyl isomerase
MATNPPSSTRRVRGTHESKSATVRAAAAAPSKRQLSRWQRDQQQQHMLYLAVGALVAVVVLIFAAGIIYDNVVRANQVVAQVGPDSITTAQLLDEVRPQAKALDAQAQQYGGTSNSQIASYLDQQKRGLPDQVLNDLVDVHIIQQEADRRGISVSSSEVDDKLRQTVAAYEAQQNPPAPTPEASATPQATDQTDQALTSATPESTELPVTAALTPTALPTPSALTTPTAIPTLEDAAYGPALQNLLSKENLTEADLRTQLERGLLQQKVQDAMGQDQVPDTQPEVHARQILVATQDQANTLLTQLQGGVDFAQLAQANSTDTATKANGGDMGWFPKGLQTQQIDDAVFSLQPGQLSNVVSDSAGYHILQVLETDPNRAVPPTQLTSLRQKAFQDWLQAQRGGSNVKLSLDQSQKDWILSRIGVRP